MCSRLEAPNSLRCLQHRHQHSGLHSLNRKSTVIDMVHLLFCECQRSDEATLELGRYGYQASFRCGGGRMLLCRSRVVNGSIRTKDGLSDNGVAVQLVLAFGAAEAWEESPLDAIRQAYPNASLVGCTTGGEIQGTKVRDRTLSATAIAFEHTSVVSRSIRNVSFEGSYSAGVKLAEQFAPKGLKHLLLLADGLSISWCISMHCLRHIHRDVAQKLNSLLIRADSKWSQSFFHALS